MKDVELDLLKEGARQLQLELSEDQLISFSEFHKLLKKWAAKINLTAFKKDRDLVLFNYLDSLALARFIKPGSFWLDVGTGAGFPGVPCKIVRPETRSILIDKNQKRVTFLKEAIRILGLQKIEALKQDADDSTFRDVLAGSFDLVVSRALSEPEYAFDYCFRYVKSGGILGLMLTKKQYEESTSTLSVAGENGFKKEEVFEYSLESFKEPRVVVALLKK